MHVALTRHARPVGARGAVSGVPVVASRRGMTASTATEVMATAVILVSARVGCAGGSRMEGPHVRPTTTVRATGAKGGP